MYVSRASLPETNVMVLVIPNSIVSITDISRACDPVAVLPFAMAMRASLTKTIISGFCSDSHIPPSSKTPFCVGSVSLSIHILKYHDRPKRPVVIAA